MKEFAGSNSIKRRQFITRSFAAGATVCLGCSQLLSHADAQEVRDVKTYRDKISQNSGMSYEQVYDFAFRNLLIPQLIALAGQVGRENLVEMLKNATDKTYSQPEIVKRFYNSMPKEFMNNVLNIEVIENTSTIRIYKITNCLWAKTFRESDAPDIGYALMCHGDYAVAKLDHENLERRSTLMEGHDCCYFKWTKIS